MGTINEDGRFHHRYNREFHKINGELDIGVIRASIKRLIGHVQHMSEGILTKSMLIGAVQRKGKVGRPRLR